MFLICSFYKSSTDEVEHQQGKYRHGKKEKCTFKTKLRCAYWLELLSWSLTCPKKLSRTILLQKSDTKKCEPTQT